MFPIFHSQPNTFSSNLTFDFTTSIYKIAKPQVTLKGCVSYPISILVTILSDNAYMQTTGCCGALWKSIILRRCVTKTGNNISFLCSAVYQGFWLISADERSIIVDVDMNGYFLSWAEWFGEWLGEWYHMVTVLYLLLRVFTYLPLIIPCVVQALLCSLSGHYVSQRYISSSQTS